MAWLSAVPETSNPKDKTEPVSRFDSLRAKGEDALLPPNPAKYLSDWLFEIGPTKPTGMGSAAITFGDMTDWSGIMGIEILPWEAKALRRLSVDYANEAHRATKHDRPPPYSGSEDVIVSNRDRVGMQVKALFSGLRNKG